MSCPEPSAPRFLLPMFISCPMGSPFTLVDLQILTAAGQTADILFSIKIQYLVTATEVPRVCFAYLGATAYKEFGPCLLILLVVWTETRNRWEGI